MAKHSWEQKQEKMQEQQTSPDTANVPDPVKLDVPGNTFVAAPAEHDHPVIVTQSPAQKTPGPASPDLVALHIELIEAVPKNVKVERSKVAEWLRDAVTLGVPVDMGNGRKRIYPPQRISFIDVPAL